jgi:hypothetical protein
MAFGFSFALTAIRKAIAVFSPASLFAAGEQGVWYDPSDLTTLFQDSAGTTPVTAVEQPVGKMLDKSGRGNHATQTTSTKRPVLSARYNLLTKTEDFSSADWNKDGCTVTAQGLGVFNLVAIAGSTFTLFNYVALNNVSTVLNFEVKSNGTGNNKFRLVISDYLFSNDYVATDNWVTYSVAGPHSNNSFANGIIHASVNSACDVLIRFPDMRTVNSGVNTPVYQRVNTATDYDTVGFKPYLKFDGIDDALSTGSINFTATDKVTVFAGARDITGTTNQMLFCFGTYATTGTFTLFSRDTHNGRSNFLNSGTAVVQAHMSLLQAASYTTPKTIVYSAIGDISGNITTLRLQGSDIVKSTANLGSGNYSSASLHIGTRDGGTAYYFNGNIYSLIVRGAQSTTLQITNTETYVNGKTGAY